MEQSFKIVQQLVANFKANEAAYLASNYSESQVRSDFIDKFFTALGWDVTHTKQFNPYEQEVKIENKVTMPGTQRRADYAFFVMPNYRDVKFFTEAKKPSRNLSNADDYYQAIRYAWNANTPIAVLTDFEEFHILDCRYKPDIKDSLNRKIKQYHYSHYADEEKFKEIFYLFGREAVANGSLEKFAADLPKPRGKAIQGGLFKGGYKSVDEAFLEQLDEYRNTLAKAFKKENQELGGEELTEAVQRTIDRLVFIRFLEDKGIEEPQIIGLHENKSAWNSFLAICKRFEPKYNGLIFKPHRILDGNNFNPPDDRDFADICAELSDPSSPYDFDKIPISILGSIYERFLGKVVHATAKRVEVQEKPEVRKAGGVYYTPEYIVRYIVNETVGKLLFNDVSKKTTSFPNVSIGNPLIDSRQEHAGMTDIRNGKTPDEIAKMSFADIACGSGSFLIEVYSVLLEYHDRWYNANKEKAKKEDVFEKDGHLHLSLKKKKDILTNNVYGVDIDSQAIEVTQLSLYLKMLENVSMNETHQLSMFKETILPNLSKNIVCGNSLIGTDIGGLFESKETDTLKPMNFEDVFPIVMKRGGFDAVVGNPPYVRQESLGDQKIYFEKQFVTFNGVADLYVYFIEKGIKILKNKGLFSYIVANKWLRANYGAQLRKWIKKFQIEEIIDFGDLPVFQNAVTYPSIIRIRKDDFISPCSIAIPKTLEFEDLSIYVKSISRSVAIEAFPNDSAWSLADDKTNSILYKMNNNSSELGDVVKGKIFRGVTTGFNEAFVIDEKKKNELIKENKNSKELIKPFVSGSDVKRYIDLNENKYLIFLKRGIDIKQYPSIEKHLLLYKNKLMPKPKNWKGKIWEGRKPGSYKWYEIQDSTEYYLEFERPKIMLPDISTRGNFTLDHIGKFYLANTGYIICSESKFLLGVLNSKLVTFYYQNITSTIRGGYLRFIQQYIKQIPIRNLNIEKNVDKSRRDNIEKLVEQMLEAKQKLSTAKTDGEVNRLELLCASLDRKIDEAVYELYGLTEEEIKIVEEK